MGIAETEADSARGRWRGVKGKGERRKSCPVTTKPHPSRQISSDVKKPVLGGQADEYEDPGGVVDARADEVVFVRRANAAMPGGVTLPPLRRARTRRSP